MKKNQNGFSTLVVIVLLAIVIGLAFLGFKSVSNNEAKTTQENSAVDETAESEIKTIAEGLITDYRTEENPRGYLISTPEGADAIKDTTTASFVSYLKERLANNEVVGGCKEGLTIELSSEVNVRGGLHSVSSEGVWNEDCGGGAAAFWYIKNGEWIEHTTHEKFTCEFLKTNKIYSEFAEDCINFTEDGNYATATSKANPNGSIVDALAD